MQASASHARKEELRKQIGDLQAQHKEYRDRVDDSQKTQLSDSISVDDPAQTKGHQQSKRFIDDPTQSSTSDLRLESRPQNPFRPLRCSHRTPESCSRCQAAREALKPHPHTIPAAKAINFLHLSLLRDSALSSVDPLERSVSRPHVSGYTPPGTPSLESETTTLNSSAGGERTRIFTLKPVPSTEVEDEELEERHDGRHSDGGYGDEQHIPAESNDGGSVQHAQDHIHELQVPHLLAKNSTDLSTLAESEIQPDARWTKISKALVDPKVLDNGSELYEERTHDILVFRVLNKEEIDHYTLMTHESRQSEANTLDKASSSSSFKDDRDLASASRKASLTSANDKIEPAGNLGSSKHDDRNQMEESISTRNAASVTENGDDTIQPVKKPPSKSQAQANTGFFRFNGVNLQDSNRTGILFAFFTVTFFLLGFIIASIIHSGYTFKNSELLNLIAAYLTLDFDMQMHDDSVYQILQSTAIAALNWPLNNLRNFAFSCALGAYLLPLSGSYSIELKLSLLQRWFFTYFTDTIFRIFFSSLWTISGRQLVKLIVGEPGESLESPVLSTICYWSWIFVGSFLMDILVDRLTFKKLDHISSAPVLESEVAKGKAGRMNWAMGVMRTRLHEFLLSAKRQLLVFVLSPLKKVQATPINKVRIGGQCRCGYRFYDDFIELRPWAAAQYRESLLQRLSVSKGHPNAVDQNVSRQSEGDTENTRPQNSNRPFFLSHWMTGILASAIGSIDKKNGTPSLPRYQLENRSTVISGSLSRNNELLYLLMCIPQHQYATKLLQPQISAIRSDRDFFLLLRKNYREMRGRMRRLLSLKALRSVKFVQLEMYKSELVDIRKQDDLPPEDKRDEYRYNPVPAEIIPPVGENHMLHLIENPTHAEEDGFVLDRIPKKLRQRLLICPRRGTGIGWGIYFIEGWHLSVITVVAFVVLLAGSLAFLICWSVLKHDVQGASGVAAYIIAFLGLAIGSIQAGFELT